MSDFAPEASLIENRLDPLTRQSSFLATTAIEKGPKFGIELDEKWLSETIETSKKNCFFCPENLEKATPKFPPDVLPEGRLYGIESCLFPNLIAISKLTAIVTLSKRHYLRLDEHSPEILSDALATEIALIISTLTSWE